LSFLLLQFFNKPTCGGFARRPDPLCLLVKGNFTTKIHEEVIKKHSEQFSIYGASNYLFHGQEKRPPAHNKNKKENGEKEKLYPDVYFS